jgi:hypothetical protein
VIYLRFSSSCDILGEIIGAIYGIESFPEAWISTVQKWEPLEGLYLLRAYKLYERHDVKGNFVEPLKKEGKEREREEKAKKVKREEDKEGVE